VNDGEKELLESIGARPGRLKVVSRRPWTIAVGPRAYLPGLTAALVTFGLCFQHGVLAALPTGAIAGALFTLGLVVHEAGHLLFNHWAHGVRSRMLVLRGGGAMAVVEGRYRDARSAALFAAGGPLASIAFAIGLIAAGLVLPTGPFAAALLVPAVLTLTLAAVNLLPVAPMDGYLLFRSWLWADLGARDEAERRALGWSRCLIVWGAFFSLLALDQNRLLGISAAVVCVTLGMQHHAVAKRQERGPRPRR
jgi:Zn-dependent protease